MSILPLSVESVSARVRGLVAQAHLQWVEARFGERVVRRVLNLLGRDVATEVRCAGVAGWCALDTLILLDEAIAEVCGPDAWTVAWELGRYTARIELHPMQRDLKPHNIHRSLRCAAIREGGMYDAAGESCGVVTFRGAAVWSRTYCRGIAGYCHEVLALHSATSPEVVETSCRNARGEVCAFEIRWQ